MYRWPRARSGQNWRSGSFVGKVWRPKAYNRLLMLSGPAAGLLERNVLKLLSLVSKNLILAIPVTMLLGFGLGLMAPVAWLKSLIVPLTFLMVYPMMVSLKLAKVLEGGDTKAQFLAQLINFAVIPFVAFALGRYFFPEQPYYAMGLLLAALLPTSGMTISWQRTDVDEAIAPQPARLPPQVPTVRKWDDTTIRPGFDVFFHQSDDGG